MDVTCKEIILHNIFRLLIWKNALVFVTVNGTLNGEAEDGRPGEKEGTTGQGGPPHN